ncbi:MAG: hypothetical protein ACLFQM_09585 [Fidelibacterota bacterium]
MKKLFVILIITGLLNAADWYEFRPPEEAGKSIFNMAVWLEEEAGSHGFVQNDGAQLICEDGTPIKFWGVNICSERPYTDKETVDEWVKILSEFGINSVRFHKHTYHGMPEEISTDLDSEKYERYDYFHAKLKETGIYYGWSPIYGHKPRPGDRDKLLAYDEIISADMNSHLSRSTIGLVNFAEDLQELHIELIINMLNHKNPITGLRYADDPALAFVELQNEDNIFFATNETMLEKCPTYKNLLTDKFTKWLQGKYDNQRQLAEAWGDSAFVWGEEVKNVTWDLDEGNICPVANHGIFDYEYQQASQKDEPLPLFLLDMARFLYEEQVKFYRKFEAAVRETGYKGTLVGSCWQAGSGVSHYYNLHADFIMGLIDRHNYFGGGTGHTLRPGNCNNSAMVSMPGSGLLSTGLQQVIDAPFSLSEWISKLPNEWTAEGAPIVAAYGMGLQGWDASYSFASNYPRFTEKLDMPNVYNVMSPLQMTLYPALARMIYSHEIKEGEIVSVRNVHIPSLKEGKIGFVENVRQDWDHKEFESVVPREALAVGRVGVKFTKEFQETKKPDLSDYWDKARKKIVSTTGQLEWHYDDNGYFTINTPGTKGVVGFAANKDIELGRLTLKTDNPFAVILVTSLEKEKPVHKAGRLLVTTVARARNTGMEYNADKTQLIRPGVAPVQVEAVDFSMKLRRWRKPKIYILDHGGRRTGEMIVPGSREFHISGSRYKTMYYEIVY